jgi:hypothetical protein
MGRWLVYGLGGLFLLVGVPLAAKWVPRNGVYGFRTARAFESEANWYLWNQRSGIALIVSAMIGMAVGAFLPAQLSEGDRSVPWGAVLILSLAVLGQLAVYFWSIWR